MTEPTCACGRPSPTSQLCTRCYQQLTHDLAHLPELLGELQTTLARQARMGGGKRGIGHSEPLPLDVGAMDEGDSTRRCLVNWVRTIIEDSGPQTHSDESCVRPHTEAHHIAHEASIRWHTWPANDTTAMALWLLAHAGWARRSDEAAQFAAEIHDVSVQLRRRIDRPADLAYAGPCGADDIKTDLDGDTITLERVACGTDLYAKLGADVTKCPSCGTVYDVAERKAWMLASVADYAATTTEIANALTSLAQPVTPSMIRQMVYRREVYRHGETADGAALYVIGDVLAVLTARRVREAEKLGRMSA